MPYFILGCVEPLPDERRGVVAAHAGGLDWLSGARFETPPPSPVRVTLDAEGVMLPMFQHPVPLFVDAMVSALFECGADNLEVYDAALHDPATGRDRTDYKAVNVIGAVRCADLKRSRYTAYGAPVIDVDFDSLVIDEARARGLKLFRLAECVTGIVVDESVRRHLAAVPALRGLDFIPPEAWIG